MMVSCANPILVSKTIANEVIFNLFITLLSKVVFYSINNAIC